MRALALTARMTCLLAATVALSSSPATAASAWRIATSYPRGTVSGEAVATFAQSVATNTRGDITADATFNYADPIGGALLTGAQDAGMLFAGDLIKLDGVFALSTLPFEVGSLEQAHYLACLARPAYRKAFAGHNMILLAVIP